VKKEPAVISRSGRRGLPVWKADPGAPAGLPAGASSGGRSNMITDCPHCFNKVLPAADGTCPSCRKNVNETAGLEIPIAPS